MSRNPVVTVGPADVEEEFPASSGAPSSGGDTPAGSAAGFGVGAGGTAAGAGSPSWARTVSGGVDSWAASSVRIVCPWRHRYNSRCCLQPFPQRLPGPSNKKPPGDPPRRQTYSLPHAEENSSGRGHQPPWRQFMANPIAAVDSKLAAALDGDLGRRFPA